MVDFKNFIEMVDMVGDYMLTMKKSPATISLSIFNDNVLDGAIKILNNNVSVEIKQSTIHGDGVFATRDIKKGEIIGLYPMDFIEYKKKIYSNLEKTKENLSYCDYSYAFNHIINGEELLYIGDKRKKSLIFCGHLINDACKDMKEIEFKIGKEEEIVKEMVRYNLYIERDMNVELQSSKFMVYIRAIKDIKSGEELLTTYEFPYWIKKFRMGMMSHIIDYVKTLPIKNQKFYINKMFRGKIEIA